MKKIHLIRHAKSSKEDELLADIDRPLNALGIRTCQFMAPHIYNAGCHFSNVFCSPAARAQSTIKLISNCLPKIAIKWQTDKKLYCFDSDDLIEWCRSVDESIFELLLIGHNPAFTDFCNELSTSDVNNIPTCGYIQLATDSEQTWQNLSENSFELATFLRPKELMI